ncbi:hypothetical protein F6S87_02155 [Bifidobacterium sp. BRDM6]|uniref:Phosphohydrolase-associated domain-containing protein n=2 Tax=Bifidobacterium choloepi TaxID=2614131 RepID=A0A6I5NDD7_9BIFI|nr:hypothetical protein [Bifidobacterium choloepi]
MKPSPLAGRSAGVNLTRAALDAAVKYPWTYAEAADHPKGERSLKFCVYPDDEAAFRWLKSGAPRNATPMECQVMDLADDIAYSVHDVEDAIATGTLDPADLRRADIADKLVADTRAWYGRQWDGDRLAAAFLRLRRLGAFPDMFSGSRRDLAHLKNITSMLIGRFAGSVEAATRETYGPGPLTRYCGSVVVPQDTRYEILVLKGIAVHFVMAPREREPLHGEEQQIVRDLVAVMMNDSPAPSVALEPVFLDDWANAADDAGRLRVAIDQVASLTDGSAIAMHRLLCG